MIMDIMLQMLSIDNKWKIMDDNVLWHSIDTLMIMIKFVMSKRLLQPLNVYAKTQLCLDPFKSSVMIRLL